LLCTFAKSKTAADEHNIQIKNLLNKVPQGRNAGFSKVLVLLNCAVVKPYFSSKCSQFEYISILE
jgi:predicted RNA-binding protein